jgi:hypothetical protein
MPLFKVHGDILEAFGVNEVELAENPDPNDDGVREAVATAAGVTRFGRDRDIRIDAIIPIDANGNEIALPRPSVSPETRRHAIDVDDREFGHILAGLRLLQYLHEQLAQNLGLSLEIAQVATNGFEQAPMSAEELDTFCERLNVVPKPPRAEA